MKKDTSAQVGKKINFFSWYYDQGAHDLLEIWKNFLIFVWQYFSILEMLSTLILPWRRDVTISNWRGWHPKKSLELLVSNLITRLIGVIVRLLVICAGLAAFLVVVAVGLAATFLWMGAPIFVCILFLYFFSGDIRPIVTFGILVAWFLVVAVGYFSSCQTEMLQLSPEQLLKHKILEKIAARFGFSKRKFPKEILTDSEQMKNFLKMQGLSSRDFQEIVQWELTGYQARKDLAKFWHMENLKKIKVIGGQWRYGYTVNLDRYCSDLSSFDNSEYNQSYLIGRGGEYEVLKLVLSRPDQNCALLVGSAGVGKKTLVHELARAIRCQEESSLQRVRLLSLDLGRIISDTINRGEDVENFLRVCFYEASFAGNIILLIEHLEYFLGSDGSNLHPDISAVLNEFLNIPTFRIIALSTHKEYHQLIENHDHIAKYFEVVEMSEPNEEEAVKILLCQLKKYESDRTLFTYAALKKIVTDSGRHNWQFPLPERAIDLAMDTLMFWEKNSDDQFITPETVSEFLSLKTGIKHGEIQDDERKKLLNLEEMLHKLVIGQDEAVRQVSDALRRSRSGIGNSSKPVGSFLFLGPTGVGKTETAKALAKTYFGDEKHLVRLDMSEFQTPNSIDRLLGSSQQNLPGRLVTSIKDNPYCLLLLDEIEKAYPDILDIFLQILDEGYVTDAFGEKINFRNTLIIATSNAGASLIKKMVDQKCAGEEIKQAVIDYAIENNIFRTEFLNRFEGVIFFRQLNDNELKSVVRLQLQKFVRRLAKEKNIEVTFDDATVGQIIEKGYNPIFGARSLNRYIEDVVEGVVAKKIISGEVARGEAVAINL